MTEARSALTPALWADVSAQFDAALAVPQSARPAWLEALAQRSPKLAVELRRLLAAHELDTELCLPDAALLQAALAPTLQRSGDRIGPYRLLRVLGQGGMAWVWLAEQEGGPRRQVALKLPFALAETPAAAARRFERERDLLAALEHPGIARLYDAGISAQGQTYLAMEYVAGRPLIEHAQGLRTRQRLLCFLQVLDAVAHAHGRLIVHGDLKPGNLLATADGHVKLLDFGIARLLGAEVEASSALTPAYAAPELLRGEPLTVGADVYALGRVLEELLAAGPVDGGPDQALRAVIARACATMPAKRYASAEALAAELHRWLDHWPVQALPARWPYRWRCWLRRHRGAAPALLLGLSALLAGLVLALWQAQEARLQARRAQAANGYLLGMFRTLDPRQAEAAKPEQLMRAMLQQKLVQIEQLLPDDAELADELLSVSATVYDYLGEAARSRALNQERRKRALARWGAGDARSLAAGLALLWPMLALQDTAAAEAMLRELDTQLPARGLLRAEWQLAQADRLRVLGAPPLALRQAWQLALRSYARDAPADSGRVAALLGLARLEAHEGRDGAALEALQQGEQLLRLAQPYIALDHVRLLVQQAQLQQRLGQAEPALYSAREALVRLQASLGADAKLARQPLRDLNELSQRLCASATQRVQGAQLAIALQGLGATPSCAPTP